MIALITPAFVGLELQLKDRFELMRYGRFPNLMLATDQSGDRSVRYQMYVLQEVRPRTATGQTPSGSKSSGDYQATNSVIEGCVSHSANNSPQTNEFSLRLGKS